MKIVKQCATCHEQFEMLRCEPFCSTKCEEIFHNYAPIKLIHSTYEDYKKGKHERLSS